ncbi:putative ribonuclease H-like domain-containing protein [Tanacetum coccineum]
MKAVVKEKEQLQKIVDSWKNSSKNLWKLVDSGMSSTSKVGLGYEIKSNDEVLSYEEEMNRTVFNCTEEDFVDKPLYSRFSKTDNFKGDHPLKNMEDRGIFDSGCSGHMTGNKDHLDDFEECKGGSVTFGGRVRFSWVFFLATKDETSGILQNFFRQIENQLITGTPQQNGVAERMNRTLIEAARTMLADSLLPTTFWAEAVSTACYIFNRSQAILHQKLGQGSIYYSKVGVFEGSFKTLKPQGMEGLFYWHFRRYSFVAVDQSAGQADQAVDQPPPSEPLPSSSHPIVLSANQ